MVFMQDRVPAFSAEKAMAFIEKELGLPVDVLFAQFEKQPIAAASLGQVNVALYVLEVVCKCFCTRTHLGILFLL